MEYLIKDAHNILIFFLLIFSFLKFNKMLGNKDVTRLQVGMWPENGWPSSQVTGSLVQVVGIPSPKHERVVYTHNIFNT